MATAMSDATAKLVPPGSRVAPSGNAEPGWPDGRGVGDGAHGVILTMSVGRMQRAG